MYNNKSKTKKFTALLTSVSILSGLNIMPAKAEASSAFSDSGINYTELVETIQNPAAGYTSTVWARCKPGDTPVYSPTGSIVLFFIDIGAFSSGANGTTDDSGNYTPGQDYDFDETFFTSWRKTFDNCRKNGCMIALRFRYDANGKDNPEPDSFDMVLGHIQQIKESNILEDYSDIIAFVESGFVGKWGEQHGGKYTSVDYKAQLLEAMLDCVPAPIPVTVRTPDIFAKYAGIQRSQLADEELYEAAMLSNDPESKKLLNKRVGLYNDGYMGSNSDLGTYANREIETTWLGRQTTETYFGGEFSGSIDFAKQYDTYLPENAIPEMYKTHLSYINGNIFQLYKDYTFGSGNDVDGVDNSAYYGQNVFQFIRDHIGYRFVIRKSELTSDIEQGGVLGLKFNVENTGFSNPIPHTSGYIILEQEGRFIKTAVDVDCHEWLSCTVTGTELSLKLPDSIKTGKWNVYFKASMGAYNDDIEELPIRSIRFANENVWNSSLGANYLGSFSVSEASSHGTDNYFYEMKGNSSKSGEMLTFNEQTIVDGKISFTGEWTDDMQLAQNDNGQTISVKADDKYFYVFSKMTEGSKAPVYNIQLKNPENGESYWLYFASNGFIYFNHDSYDGCACKWNANTVEFRLPFDIFGITPGMTVNNLRVFLQDSGNEWKLMGDITAGQVSVPSDFAVYSTETDIRLSKDDSYNISVRTPVSDAVYQWYLNDKPIENASGSSYIIRAESQDSAGIYSVKITSSGGIEKTVPIVNLLEVVSEDGSKRTPGDANCDGSVSMGDAVLIMQSISNPSRFGLKGSDEKHITEQGLLNADVTGNEDGVTNLDAQQIQKYLLDLIVLS